ncbi:uncharacterized protein [Diadema antillarum]|uniref:uncharacterized protein n=1 Tax=Diadema antillarum TaxID=105358 RepID=UPI003A892DF5
MASGFTPTNTIKCDECLSDVKSAEPSYRLEIQKNLCAECAIDHQDSIKEVVDTVKWTCQEHTNREAELFCVTHDYPICRVCAVTSNHTDCKRYDIHEVRKDRERELAELICQANARSNGLKQNYEEIQHHIFQVTKRLTMIGEQVSAAAEEEETKVTQELEQREDKINADCDEEIRKLNEKRNEMLKETRDEAEKKLHVIRDEQKSLENQLDLVKRELESRKTKLMYGLEHLNEMIRERCVNAKNLIIKQENLMRDFHDITRQLCDCVGVEIGRERLDKVKELIEEIKYDRASGLLGAVVGFEERLVKVKEIEIVSTPLGCIGENGLVCSNKVGIFVLDLAEGTPANFHVIFLPKFTAISYNSLPDGGHVFGTTDGKLMVYDRLWYYRRKIDTKTMQSLEVTVNNSGSILTAEPFRSSISEFNPNNGKCIHTIKLADGMHISTLKTMSTGDVIVVTETSHEGPSRNFALPLHVSPRQLHTPPRADNQPPHRGSSQSCVPLRLHKMAGNRNLLSAQRK